MLFFLRIFEAKQAKLAFSSLQSFRYDRKILSQYTRASPTVDNCHRRIPLSAF
jgi:hypothetical protein